MERLHGGGVVTGGASSTSAKGSNLSSFKGCTERIISQIHQILKKDATVKVMQLCYNLRWHNLAGPNP